MSKKRAAAPSYASALFPGREEFPQTKKMSDTYNENMAIYEFVKHLVESGYVLARRSSSTGQIQVMEPWKTSEYEILMFRGVDRIAYAVEANKLRAAYPHLIQIHGIEGDYEPPLPQVAEHIELAEHPREDVPDDREISFADAFRTGVIRASSYASARMKMMRSRRLYPEIVPKMRPQGAHTLYRVGDLRTWEAEYDKKSTDNHRAAAATRSHTLPERAVTLEQPVAESMDALTFLLGKIRGEEEK